MGRTAGLSLLVNPTTSTRCCGIEARAAEAAETEARGQLELFGALLNNFATEKSVEPDEHCITIDEDRSFEGTWEEILQKMSEARGGQSSGSVRDFMVTEARRGYSLTGHLIPTEDAESFIAEAPTRALQDSEMTATRVSPDGLRAVEPIVPGSIDRANRKTVPRTFSSSGREPRRPPALMGGSALSGQGSSRATSA